MIFFGLKNSEKNHWFQRYITTWVKEFWKWAKNIKISYFWAKRPIWPKNSLFWRFWPISNNIWYRLLYTVGISDFFLNFWDQKKWKKSIFFFFSSVPNWNRSCAYLKINANDPKKILGTHNYQRNGKNWGFYKFFTKVLFWHALGLQSVTVKRTAHLQQDKERKQK